MSNFKNELKTPEKKYFNIINSILDIIVELELDLTINYINPQVYDLVGYSPEEVIGENSIDFVHQDDVLKVVESIKKGIKTKDVISENFRIRHKNGNYVPVSAKGRLVEYENQSKIVVVFRDVTKEQEVELRLKGSDKRYREIIENIEDGYFETGLKGIFTYVNNYICKYLGISREELLGKSYNFVLDKDTTNEVYKTFNKVYTENLPKGVFESKVIRSDGENRTFEGSFYLKYDSNGKKVGFYGFTRDITERKKAEEKQKLSEVKYKEAYGRAELYKDLFYHDINNILSNIKLSIDMSEKYLDKPGNERDIKDLYDLIRGQFGRGAKLISNVRKLSSLENLERSLKSVDVNKALKDAIHYVQKSQQSKDINIKIESSEKKIFTRANELLIDVFDNLLINAVNYNESLKKEVLIKISRESKNNIKYIKFEFIDNGIGISNKRKENIFQDRFNKEKGSKGMGFGLTLVKKIVESYKGKIWIEDRVEGDYAQGSNFIFLIPEAEK